MIIIINWLFKSFILFNTEIKIENVKILQKYRVRFPQQKIFRFDSNEYLKKVY